MTSRLNYLLERYLAKTCTEQERQELAYMALDPDYEEEIRRVLSAFYNRLEPSDDLTEQQSASILTSILRSSQHENRQAPQHNIPQSGEHSALQPTEHNTLPSSQYHQPGSGHSTSSTGSIHPANSAETIRSGNSAETVRSGASPGTVHPGASIGTIPHRKHLFARKHIAIAASVMLTVAGAYLLLQKNTGEATGKEAISQGRQDVKAPVADKAMIVLSGGKTVLLDSLQQETLALQGDVHVTRTKDGRIVYKGNPDESGKMVFNTLVNPRGSKVVHLTLQDGTRVWLNCESSIKYPVAFEDKERVVEITGEAYFEVTRDASKKFVVMSGGVKTEVLGTHFNVNAYKDGPHTRVTLLEGSVRISNSASATLLTPHQQASLNETSKINIAENVETDEVVAWKDGIFNFDSLPLNSIMQQLVRWYDIEVVYDGTISEKYFSGIFSRNDNISEILKMMELAGLHFKIDGRKITVTQ